MQNLTVEFNALVLPGSVEGFPSLVVSVTWSCVAFVASCLDTVGTKIYSFLIGHPCQTLYYLSKLSLVIIIRILWEFPTGVWETCGQLFCYRRSPSSRTTYVSQAEREPQVSYAVSWALQEVCEPFPTSQGNANRPDVVIAAALVLRLYHFQMTMIYLEGMGRAFQRTQRYQEKRVLRAGEW